MMHTLKEKLHMGHSHSSSGAPAQATATHKASGTVLAASDSSAYQVVEGNIYFPPASILVPSGSLVANNYHTGCPWKGQASYYDLKLDDGTSVSNVGWFYPQPLSKAENIRDFVAFDKSKVNVEKQ